MAVFKTDALPNIRDLLVVQAEFISQKLSETELLAMLASRLSLKVFPSTHTHLCPSSCVAVSTFANPPLSEMTDTENPTEV